MDEIKEPEGMYPELNRELLVKVVDHALSAENYDQTMWYRRKARTECGTAMCVAGFTAIEFAGWKPVFYDGNDGFSSECSKDGGEPQLIENVARAELGLTRYEASELFWSKNTPAAIRTITQNILDGAYRE